MHETETDLITLQQLLDDSYAAGGSHLLGIHTPERRLTAAQTAGRLHGMCLLVLATTTRDNRPITGPGYSMSPPFFFDPLRNGRDQVFGFIFTGASLAEATLMNTLQEWTAAHERIVWPNLYCDFNTFLVSYEAEDGLSSDPMDATNFYVAGPEEHETLLLLFLAILSSFINAAHVARPELLDYAGIGQTIHSDYPLLAD